MNRQPLPQRRSSENFVVHALNTRMTMTVGYYPDGRPGEVFTSDIKVGSAVDAISRDAAILLSLCMQYGVPLGVVAGAVTREGDGSASSVIGALVDQLVPKQH